MRALTPLDAPAVSARSPAPWLYRTAAYLATAAAIALLGCVIAYWGWRWLGPPAFVPAPAPMPERWSAAIASAPIFGRAAPSATPTAASDTPAPTDIRLLGVFAEKDGAGYALFRLRDGPVLVRAGADLAVDVTLMEVRPGGVRLRERGATRDIELRAQAPVARVANDKRSPVDTRIADARAPAGACAPPAGYKGPVYRLNAELLSGVASRPDTWKDILVPVADGLSIRDGSSFATMLGMRRGDRMTQANGIALAGVDDVLVAFVKPLLASQSVHVAGVRSGKPAEWLFVNAGSCPG